MSVLNDVADRILKPESLKFDNERPELGRTSSGMSSTDASNGVIDLTGGSSVELGIWTRKSFISHAAKRTIGLKWDPHQYSRRLTLVLSSL